MQAMDMCFGFAAPTKWWRSLKTAAKTWQMKHKKVDGEVLLTLGLLGEKTVYASGTNGAMVWSD